MRYKYSMLSFAKRREMDFNIQTGVYVYLQRLSSQNYN